MCIDGSGGAPRRRNELVAIELGVRRRDGWLDLKWSWISDGSLGVCLEGFAVDTYTVGET
jgi:hypothetical protein